jgi:hypothetical protein
MKSDELAAAVIVAYGDDTLNEAHLNEARVALEAALLIDFKIAREVGIRSAKLDPLKLASRLLKGDEKLTRALRARVQLEAWDNNPRKSEHLVTLNQLDSILAARNREI